MHFRYLNQYQPQWTVIGRVWWGI